MKPLQIDAVTARKEYAGASPVIKAIFEQSFGKEFFSTDIRERINNMDDVFAETGTDKDDFYEACEGLRDHEVAGREAELIAKAYNEGKEINGLDPNQRKWSPLHLIDGPAGFRFGGSDCDYSLSVVGSRLQFVEERLSDDAGVKFLGVYKRLKTA